MKGLLLALGLVGVMGCHVTPIGTMCDSHQDCEGIERGYCAKVQLCTRSCSSAVPCPREASCVLSGDRRVCLRRCLDDVDCESTQRCVEWQGEYVCAVRDIYKPPFDVRD